MSISFKRLVIHEKPRTVCYHVCLIGINQVCHHPCIGNCLGECKCLCRCYLKIGPLKSLRRYICGDQKQAHQTAVKLLYENPFLISAFVIIYNTFMQVEDIIAGSDCLIFNK